MAGRTVLEDVAFRAPRGAVTALVGPNGAGKSTLLRAVLGLVPCDGDVRIDGNDVRAASPEARARTLAWVPQRSALRAALPVHAVVAQGRHAHGESPRAARPHVDAALARVGASHLAARDMTTLSGGEAQCVLLARALATGAAVLLLDEPTAALDLAGALRVLGILRTLADDGHAIVAVLHGIPDALRHAHRAVVLADGRTRAEGPVEDVLTPARLAETWGVRWVEAGAPAFDALGPELP
jgi:iron complex transport system ATP-binding protein